LLAADIARDDITIARSARLPTLSLSAGYSERDSEFRQTTVLATDPSRSTIGFSEPSGYNWSLNLNVPLFTGGLNSSRIQQTAYQHRASLQASERVARETERLTRDAYLGVVSSIAQVDALRQAVQSAETALRATEAGFEVGTRTSVDVVVSQDQLRQAQTNYARARYQYILSTLQLRQATGTLSIDDVELVDSWLMQ
jgi:outer membrane protein